MGETFRDEKSLNSLSKPVDKTSVIREATQNQTRTVKIRKRVNPSAVIVRFAMPMCAVQIELPDVKNKMGRDITAAKRGIRAVREKKCLSGILELIAKIIGTTQIISKYDKLKIKREATIIAIMATSLARGFIACNTPLRELKSSRYTSDSALSTKSRRDCGTFICLTLLLAQ
jgi:hypothetical protein